MSIIGEQAFGLLEQAAVLLSYFSRDIVKDNYIPGSIIFSGFTTSSIFSPVSWRGSTLL